MAHRHEQEANARVLQQQEATLRQLTQRLSSLRSTVERHKASSDELLRDNKRLQGKIGGYSGGYDERAFNEDSVEAIQGRLRDTAEAAAEKGEDASEARRLLEEEKEAKQNFIDRVHQIMCQIEQRMVECKEREQSGLSQQLTSPVSVLKDLEAFEIEREERIRELHEEYAELYRTSNQKDEQLAHTRQRAARDIPKVQKRKGAEYEHTSNRWRRERAALEREYDRLDAINKEQKFHLHRGTYLKIDRSKAKPSSDQKLEDESKELAKDLHKLRERVQEQKEEGKDLDRQMDSWNAQFGADEVDYQEEMKRKRRILSEEAEISGRLQSEVDRLDHMSGGPGASAPGGSGTKKTFLRKGGGVGTRTGYR